MQASSVSALAGTRPVASAIPWAQFEREFLSLYGPPLGPATTKAKYRQVLAEFGATGIETTADLDPTHVAAWIRAWSETRALATIESMLKHLRTAANYAVKRAYLNVSPFALRSVGRWVDGLAGEGSLDEYDLVERHLPQGDIARVLQHLALDPSIEGRKLHALASLVAYTGIRKAEALNVKVADLQLDHGVVLIRRRPGSRLKTRKSAAPVPLPEPLIAILREWLPCISTGTWVFPGPKSRGPWTGGSNGTKALERLKAAGMAVGVEGFGFLKLRHSWATHAEAWGLTDGEIMRILRHTTPITSKAWYRHPDLPNLRQAATKVRFAAGQGGAVAAG